MVWIFLSQNLPEVAYLIYLLYTVIPLHLACFELQKGEEKFCALLSPWALFSLSTHTQPIQFQLGPEGLACAYMTIIELAEMTRAGFRAWGKLACAGPRPCVPWMRRNRRWIQWQRGAEWLGA